MRSNPSSTERLLWKLLRDRRLEGLKFRRQIPIGPYIADFACYRHFLIVEADGYWHDAAADAVRDLWLNQHGFRVLRFDNNDIVGRQELVLAAILNAVKPKDDPLPVALVESGRTSRRPGARFTDGRV
jgi:very-short-patch-repair endonuclease